MKNKVFVFREALNLEGEITLNTHDNIMTLKIKLPDNTIKSVDILTSHLVGRTVMVIYSPMIDDLIVHYDWHEICTVMGITHSELLKISNCFGIMQIDGIRMDKEDVLLTKVFLPYKQFKLLNDNDDYIDNLYYTIDCVNPIDWQFTPTFQAVKAYVENNKLHLTLELAKPITDNEVWINYCGQYYKLENGINELVLDYVYGENAYIGNKHTRYKGRELIIEKALRLCDN